MRSKAVAGLLVALAACLAPERDAAACSCVRPHPERRVVPSDGAIDFPTRGTVRVFLSGFPSAARRPIGAEYRLRDAQGTVAPVDVAVVGTRVDLRPRAPLAPQTSYTVEQVFAFDDSGRRLSDLERLRSPSGSLRGAWYAVAAFTTGAARPTHRTALPTLKDAHLHVLHGGGDCGPATVVMAGVSPGAALPTDIVELEVRSRGPVVSSVAPETSDLYAGDTLCDPDPVTLPPGPVVVRAVVRDASGATLGATPWVRAQDDGPRPASAAREWFSSGWPSVTMVTPAAIAAQGPADCVNGLQVVARYDVVAEGAPWMYADRALLDGDVGSRWAAFAGPRDGDPMQVLAVGDNGAVRRLPPRLAGYPAALASTPRGPLLAYDTYTPDGHSRGHLEQLDAQGAPVWSRDMADDMRHRRLVPGGGDVLVAWTTASGPLGAALFHAQDGAAVANLVTTYGVDRNSEAPAAAWVDGRFLLVWESAAGFRAGPLVSAVASASGVGATNDLSAIGTYAPPDLAAAGARAGLATGTGDGRILFTLLDRDGRVAAAPVEVSYGLGRDSRLPRVAWNGHDFAVAWETYPSAGTYVALVDERRNVSPALRIDASEPSAGTVGVLATARGWMASYTTQRGHGRIAELRCAAHALGGAPQSIGPGP